MSIRGTAIRDRRRSFRSGFPVWAAYFAVLGVCRLVAADSPVPFTANEAAVNIAFEQIKPASAGGLFTMINSIGNETVFEQRASLTQLSGEVFGNTQTIGLQSGDQYQQRIVTRLVSNGQFLTGLSRDQIPNDDQLDADARGQSPLTSSGSWTQGFGVGGRLNSDGNGVGLNYSQGGLVSGIDLAVDESGVMGISWANAYTVDSLAVGR